MMTASPAYAQESADDQAAPDAADSKAADSSAAAVEKKAPPVEPPTHMSESLRSSMRKIVVLPTSSPAGQQVKGSYQEQTSGLIGGANRGSQWGTISRDIYGVRLNFPIRILTLPGAILGGLTGGTKRQIQDFRDRLTENLASAAENPLSNEALASDVFWDLRVLKDLEPKIYALSTPLPTDMDAVLYVDVTDVSINVDGKDAVLTTTANATLRRMSDGAHVYEKIVFYEDRDTLKNWTRNDVALWEVYTNFARHYLAREIAAETYARVARPGAMEPLASENVNTSKESVWVASSDSTTPTLAWTHDQSDGSAATADVTYEVEIYNSEQLVYSAKRVTAPTHTIDVALSDCGEYRWSVRPVFVEDGVARFGDWMRRRTEQQKGNGNVGRSASTAPAYTIDFPLLDVKCRRRKR